MSLFNPSRPGSLSFSLNVSDWVPFVLASSLSTSLSSVQFQEIKSNKTVLHLAVKEGNVELVRYLLTIRLPNMKDFVNLKVSPVLTLPLRNGFELWDSCSLCLFVCHRLMATQLYTWQRVFTVTPTRRKSCACCWAEKLTPVSATWRMTSRPTCCRVVSVETRSAAHSVLCLFGFSSEISSHFYPIIILFVYSFFIQLKLMLKKRGASSRRRIVSSQDQEWFEPLVILIWRECVITMLPLLTRGLIVLLFLCGVSGLYFVHKLVWYNQLRYDSHWIRQGCFNTWRLKIAAI